VAAPVPVATKVEQIDCEPKGLRAMDRSSEQQRGHWKESYETWKTLLWILKKFVCVNGNLSLQTSEAKLEPFVVNMSIHAALWTIFALSVFVRADADAAAPLYEWYAMPDLGYPVPSWSTLREGNPLKSAVEYDDSDFMWGDIEPYNNGTLCKWFPDSMNAGRGACKTDLSWLHAATGITRNVFEDPVVNYILRFFIHGACYRSTEVRPQLASHTHSSKPSFSVTPL
jgi:hypothetical protein